MGKLLSGGVLSNNLTGKIGNVVYSRVSNVTTIRMYQPKVTNPNTRAQKIQRLKFKTVNDVVSECYKRLNSVYGKAANQYTKRTAVSAMIFRNPLILAQGYQDNYYPKSPVNNQNLICGSYDLTNEALNKIEFHFIPAVSGSNPDVIIPIFRIPKSQCDITTSVTGTIHLGTNIPMTSLNLLCCVNAKAVANIASTINKVEINENYNGSDDFSVMVSASSSGVSSGFKYLVKFTTGRILSSGDDYLIAFTEAEGPVSYGFDSGSVWAEHILKGTWLGDPTATAGADAERIGITMFALTENKTDNLLFDDDSRSSLLSKVCIAAKNYVIDRKVS